MAEQVPLVAAPRPAVLHAVSDLARTAQLAEWAAEESAVALACPTSGVAKVITLRRRPIGMWAAEVISMWSAHGEISHASSLVAAC